ncbi:MAG: superoxide dismutase family protein [Candidatus Margulisiibacteriota bacterium]
MKNSPLAFLAFVFSFVLLVSQAIYGASAVAIIRPASQSKVWGTVRFETENDGVKVTGTLNNLKPGLHGFHVHEFGDCTAADGSSAGGHYNPTDVAHGNPMDNIPHHIGDLGNIEVPSSGIVKINKFVSGINLIGVDTIIGRGLIVHADPDDLRTQPSGASGARIGCGVIGIAKP